MPAAAAFRSVVRDRQRDPLPQLGRRHQQEQHAGPEHHAERRLPRHLVLQDDREREEGVQAHARRDGERQPRVQPHQQRHAAGDQHGRGQRAGERHAGSAGRQDRRIDHDDVGHREEGGHAADDVGVQRAIVRGSCLRHRRERMLPSRASMTRLIAAAVAAVLVIGCGARAAAPPLVVQGAMDVEIRKLAGADRARQRRARRRLHVLARHDRRLSRRDLEDPQGHGERRGGHRARRRTLPPDRDHQPGHRRRPRCRNCTSTTSSSARSAVNLGSFKTGYRARRTG